METCVESLDGPPRCFHGPCDPWNFPLLLGGDTCVGSNVKLLVLLNNSFFLGGGKLPEMILLKQVETMVIRCHYTGIPRICYTCQWPFQEPKLEVPTIYKAYIRPM